MANLADTIQQQVTRYVANAEFTQAVLFFGDGSYLQLEHKGVDKRWAKPSATDSMADHACAAMRMFRLNAKHLQLYFEDDSDVEFFVTA